MQNSVSFALEKFFNQLDDDKKAKYKLGIIDFVSKLKLLTAALNINDEKAITALLHSVKPISEYLKLNDMHALLLRITIENPSEYFEISPMLESQIIEIENLLILY